jgi:hypothetical protein
MHVAYGPRRRAAGGLSSMSSRWFSDGLHVPAWAKMLLSCSLVPSRCSASHVPAPACSPLVVSLVTHDSADHQSASRVALGRGFGSNRNTISRFIHDGRDMLGGCRGQYDGTTRDRMAMYCTVAVCLQPWSRSACGSNIRNHLFLLDGLIAPCRRSSAWPLHGFGFANRYHLTSA